MTPTNVVIAGGGVAALEAALALRDLGGDRVALTMLAPQTELVYQPLSVADPFALGSAKRYPLSQVAEKLDLELRHEALESVDPASKLVRTDAAEHGYDKLLVAVGAGREAAYEHALTFRGQEDTEPARGLVQDLEGGYVKRFAFVVPPGSSWPLPLYELALMTARRARESSADVEITLVTPEESPLGVFGVQASEAVAGLLSDAGIGVELRTRATIERTGEVLLHPGDGRLEVERVVALPRVVGRAVEGLPHDDQGFLPIDQHARVRGVDDVYAAGDGTDFPLKQGGIACQQADAAASAIAAEAGASVEAEPFRPVLRGQLLTGGAPQFLRHSVEGGHGDDSEVSQETLWYPPSKISGRYLAPFLGAAQEAEQMRDGAEMKLDMGQLGDAVSSRAWI
jgi:sulfide:quinone oxidoreductase